MEDIGLKINFMKGIIHLFIQVEMYNHKRIVLLSVNLKKLVSALLKTKEKS